MKVEEKIKGFEKLGRFLGQFSSVSFNEERDLYALNEKFKKPFEEAIEGTEKYNPWFTPEFIRLSFSSISNSLKEEYFHRWTEMYPEIREENSHKPLGVVVIMAGNIPLVGFLDFFCVIMSGNTCRIKLSSKDDKLFPLLGNVLIHLNRDFENSIVFEEGNVRNPDAVIATGSNNSSRYFNYYFGKYPHIIRKNRNSVAVLTGSESDRDLKTLADDVFSYFGLGCRNVSKIFLPINYEIPALLKNFEGYSYLANHNRYINNYDYYRAIHLVNSEKFYDTGFLIFRGEHVLRKPCRNSLL